MNRLIKKLMVVLVAALMFIGVVATPVQAKEAGRTWRNTAEPENTEEIAADEDQQTEENLVPAETPAETEDTAETAEEDDSVADETEAVEPEAIETETAEVPAVEETVEEEFFDEEEEPAEEVVTYDRGLDGETSISAGKSVTDEDGDGIYELELSVTGSADTSMHSKVPKSNVVIIIDVSDSMDSRVTAQRIKYTYDSNSYDEDNVTYQGVYNGSYYSLRWRNNAWQIYRNYQWRSYSGEAYIYANTRIGATKAAAYNLIDSLLSNNKPGQQTPDGISLGDVVEIALMSFSGSTEYYGPTSIDDADILVAKSVEAATLKRAVRDLDTTGGTNWEAALRRGLTAANTLKAENETTSVVFLTDGMPTFYLNNANSRSARNGGAGTEDIDNVHNCWNYSADDAKAIVDAGYKFYSVFAFGSPNAVDQGRTPSDFLLALTNYAYDGDGTPAGEYTQTNTDPHKGKEFFDATDTTELENAFKSIAESITNNIGYAGVEYLDGVTLGVTNTSVTVNGSVNEQSLHYTVVDSKTEAVIYTVSIANGTATFNITGVDGELKDTSAETVITKIDPANESTWIYSDVYSVTVGEGDDAVTYAMSPATIDSDGLVKWDLAGLGILENDYTYKLSFDVWPKQNAYDMVADLNNQVITIEDIQSDPTVDWEELKKALVVTINGTTKPAEELTAEEIEAINKGTATCRYAILSNWKQEVHYYKADEETTESGTTTQYVEQPVKYLDYPDTMKLVSDKMDFYKHWPSDLQPEVLQRLLYNADGSSKEVTVNLKVWKADTLAALNNLIAEDVDETEYKTVKLGWDGTEYNWDSTLDVSPGTMIELSKAQDMGIDTSDASKKVTYGEKTYYILESGHYYTVTEVEHDYHYDLITIIYHPMLVDGVLSNVTFKEDGTVEKIEPMSAIEASNTLRGGINLKKNIVDSKGNDLVTDTNKFDFTVVLTNDNPVFVGDDIPWYGVNGKYYHNADGEYIDASATGDQDGDGLDDDGNIPEVSEDKKTATYTLKAGRTDEIRINNVPVGTTYTVTESQLQGYELVSATKEVALGNTVESTETIENLVVNGEIVPNRENNITYTNKPLQEFYVYHSGVAEDGNLTVYPMKGNETFNIFEKTTEGKLYGGYYLDYAGKGDYQDDGVKSTGGVEYTGQNVAWNADDACVVSGEAMNPEAGETYYIKEVPTYYLRNYYQANYNLTTKDLKSMYLISDLDDRNYTETGYYLNKNGVAEDTDEKFTAENGKLYKQITFSSTVTSSTIKLQPHTVFRKVDNEFAIYAPDKEAGILQNYLSYLNITKMTENYFKKDSEFTVRPYWKTFDGIEVRGISVRIVKLGSLTRNTVTKEDKFFSEF